MGAFKIIAIIIALMALFILIVVLPLTLLGLKIFKEVRKNTQKNVDAMVNSKIEIDKIKQQGTQQRAEKVIDTAGNITKGTSDAFGNALPAIISTTSEKP